MFRNHGQKIYCKQYKLLKFSTVGGKLYKQKFIWLYLGCSFFKTSIKKQELSLWEGRLSGLVGIFKKTNTNSKGVSSKLKNTISITTEIYVKYIFL